MATYTLDSPIAGGTRGIPDDWIRWAEQQGVHRFDDVELYIHTIYEFAPKAGLAAHKLIAQSVHEASEAHPKTGKYIPWTSEAWTECVNPTGIGVTGPDMRAWHDFKNGRNAALAHLVRVSKYVYGPVPDALKPYEHLDPRGAVPASVYGQKKTLGSFGNSDWRNHPTWAADDTYGQKWADVLNRLEPVFAESDSPTGTIVDIAEGIANGVAETITDVISRNLNKEGDDMAGLKKHRFVGLDKDVLLPDDIEVIIDIVPSSRTNVRSNQRFTGQTHLVYHQTGNFSQGANAWSERNYLHGGAGGRYVGYNFAVDDKRIIQLTPLNETTWHAGQAWWNQHSWGVEQCVGGGINRARAERNASALHGGLAAAKGWDASERVVMHQRVYGKLCPQTIIQAGTWPTVIKNIVAFAGAAAGKAVGDIVDGWPYPDPVPPSFWSDFQQEGTTHFDDGGTVWYKTNALYRVKTRTRRQQYAVQDNRVVGPELEPGTEFRAGAVGLSKTDKAAWVITPMLTRVRLDALEFVGNDNDDA